MSKTTGYSKLVNGGGDPESGKKVGASGDKKAPSAGLIMFACIFYATCSSTMLVINKLTVYHIQAPSFVLFCQTAATAAAVYSAAGAGWVKADPFEKEKVKAFFWVVAAFVAAIFTNMKTLQYANVETFIVFRSSTPLLVAFLDFLFLGRALPSARSWASLFFILVGAFAYMSTDSTFEVRSYSWATAWYVPCTPPLPLPLSLSLSLTHQLSLRSET